MQLSSPFWQGPDLQTRPSIRINSRTSSLGTIQPTRKGPTFERRDYSAESQSEIHRPVNCDTSASRPSPYRAPDETRHPNIRSQDWPRRELVLQSHSLASPTPSFVPEHHFGVNSHRTDYTTIRKRAPNCTSWVTKNPYLPSPPSLATSCPGSTGNSHHYMS